MRFASFCGRVVLVLMVSVIAVNAEVCDQYKFGIAGTPSIQMYIYADGESWNFTATKNLSVQTITVKSVLATASAGTFHIQIKHNNNVIVSRDQYVNSSTFKAYSQSANVSVNLKVGDTITYYIYGGTMSTSVGAILQGGSIGVNQVRLCGTESNQTVVKGDIDDNKTVNLADAILILKVLTGITPSQTINKAADVNGDGKIGLAECMYVLQIVAGLRTQ